MRPAFGRISCAADGFLVQGRFVVQSPLPGMSSRRPSARSCFLAPDIRPWGRGPGSPPLDRGAGMPVWPAVCLTLPPLAPRAANGGRLLLVRVRPLPHRRPPRPHCPWAGQRPVDAASRDGAPAHAPRGGAAGGERRTDSSGGPAVRYLGRSTPYSRCARTPSPRNRVDLPGRQAVCVLARRFSGGLGSLESSPVATLSRGAFSAPSLVTPTRADTSWDRVVPACNNGS
jgi:hypothetical protein